MVEFKIRLLYEQLSMSDFFRMMVKGLIEKDVDLEKYLTTTKKFLNIHSIRKRRDHVRLIEAGHQLEKDFALTDEEIESFYDISKHDSDFYRHDEKEFDEEDPVPK